jgi:hypothetical protein
VASQPNMGVMEVNMVFVIPVEFHAPENKVVELALGDERAMFKKPVKAGKHMRPLFIKGHLRASVNIMSLAVFERLGHREDDLID